MYKVFQNDSPCKKQLLKYWTATKVNQGIPVLLQQCYRFITRYEVSKSMLSLGNHIVVMNAYNPAIGKNKSNILHSILVEVLEY
jgi:hypothetical protein